MKRLIDILGACFGIIILTPLFFIVALLVRKKLGSPVLFSQVRAGLKGRRFNIIKFRTMIDSRDKKGEQLPDEKRLTRFGKILRSTSLDELPELYNVLKGDMSLVGPRPLLVEYVDRYTPEQARRLEVKPGITGWAQVNGRNELSWEERFKLDEWYVEHKNFGLDLKILWLTMGVLIGQRGISAADHATMPTFYGSKRNGLEENSNGRTV